MSDELLDELAIRTGRDRSRDYVATVASLSPLEVIYKGQRVGAINGMPNHCHVVGDPVRVTQFAQQLVITSTAAKLPVLAVVSAYAASTANVTVVSGDDTFDAQILGTGWTPTVGDRVAILWTAAGPLAAKRGGPVASPADPPLPPDGMNATNGPPLPAPPPTNPIGSAVLYTQQTATYLNTSRSTAGNHRYWVYAAFADLVDVVTGAFFYGDQLSKVRGVTATKAEIWLARATGYGANAARTVQLELHNNKVRTEFNPSSSFSHQLTLKPGQSGWFTIPTTWGQRLADRSSAGIATYDAFSETAAGYNNMALLGIDHPNAALKNVQSGAIRITYKRS